MKLAKASSRLCCDPTNFFAGRLCGEATAERAAPPQFPAGTNVLWCCLWIMDFAERCFVAMAAAGFVGLIASMGLWMWLI
jgi:hypothetical protein